MSQIRIPSLAFGLLLSLVVFALSGCGDKNSQATFDAATGKHVSNATWKVAGHMTVAKASNEACKECHGTDLKGGTSKVDCTTQCHMDSVDKTHFTAWGTNILTKHISSTDTTRCGNASCHAANLLGVTGSGPSCTSCHLGDATHKHPVAWGVKNVQAFYSSHRLYVGRGATTNGTATCANAACHATNLQGTSDATNTRASGPSCSNCHVGDATHVHPVLAAGQDWRNVHQGYLLTGLNLTETRARCDNIVCHGVFDDATKPGLIKTNKTCGACHAADVN